MGDAIESEMVAAATPETPPAVTPATFARLREIVASDEAEGRFLRVSVLGGGCSGFQYRFELEAAAAEDDLVFQDDNVAVVIDPTSASFLAGAVIDYKKELIGARFAIENPNASSTCGCGVSFSV